MALDAHEFMQKMQNRIHFTEEDKNVLQAEADWGREIAPKMAEHF